MRKIYPFLKLVFVLLITGPLSAQTTDLIISEYAEGSSFNKYIEIYNGTGAPVNLTDYEIWRISNGGTWPEASSGLTGTLANDSTLVIANGQADPTILNLPNAVVDGILSHNGDDAIGLAKDDGTNNFFLIDAVGSSGADPGSGWDVAGTTNGTANHTLVRKDSVCSPDTNWSVTAGTSASTSQWIVYPSDTWTYVGSHTSTCSGGNPTPPSTPFYNIADINNVDANGVADSLGVECFTQGLVMGVDLNSGSGYSFTLWDGEGIGVFNFSDVNGYTVQEGDSIIIKGEVDQFNGLTQLGSIDSISVVNTGNPLPSPTVITSLDESTESESFVLITLKLLQT
jgi:predicted extracellular nuclease